MCMYACTITQLHLTLCDPMDCSPPGSSVPGILQARILEEVAIPFSRGSSQPKDQTCVSCISCIGRQIRYHCFRKIRTRTLIICWVPTYLCFLFFSKSYATLQSSFYSSENLALGMLRILSMVTHFIWTCHIRGMPGQYYPTLCPSPHYSTLNATKEQIQHATNVHLHGNNVPLQKLKEALFFLLPSVSD